MYTVLARKYRPKNFEEVCGQDHITKVLKSAIKEDRVAHAYLFSGPRGTGKTSVARILAKALNCEKDSKGAPCEKCSSCRTISAGASLDVLEIDGASNRGIEEIRKLRENVNLRPVNSPFKIYIIDEVHMLTPDACNALLKTLEEPPSYVKFLFATTAPEKILPTILSRCQKFSFRPLSREELVGKLLEICREENASAEKDALDILYEFSGGSVRDALSMLDQLIVNAGDGPVTRANTAEFLGIVEEEGIVRLLTHIRKGEIKDSISELHRFFGEGKDPALILDGMVRKVKFLVLASLGQEKPAAGHDSMLAEEFATAPIETLLDAVTMIIEYKDKLRRESLPVVLTEVLFFKLSSILKKEGFASSAEEAETKGDCVKEKPEQESGEEEAGEKRDAGIFASGVSAVPQPEDKGEQEKEKKTETPKKVKKEPAGALEDILGKWDTILTEVKKSKPTLVAALREGIPQKGSGGEISINFGKKYAFHKSKAEQPSNKKLLQKIISKIAGFDAEITFDLDIEEKESIINSDEVKKVVEFFDGEIVESEE